jgi:hypothetical protein
VTLSQLEQLEIEALAEGWERAARIRRTSSARGVAAPGLIHTADVYDRCARELRALLEQLKGIP